MHACMPSLDLHLVLTSSLSSPHPAPPVQLGFAALLITELVKGSALF
jgi:hypothetical protein